ncbi:hypothetical protein B4070_4266 [Bacillus subtilis]|nr:hypothetical protein B4070_4266 [Bacillus subtilis]
MDAFLMNRGIFNHDIWSDVVKFRIFFYLIGNAVSSKEGIQQDGVHVQQGQYLRSLRNLQDDLAYREGKGNKKKVYPLTTLRRKLKSLENDGEITTKLTDSGTLFTVVNYASYQGLQGSENEIVAQKRHTDGTPTAQKEEPKPKKKRYVYDEKQMALAGLLWKKVKVNAPDMKEPNMESWANTIRLMMQQDERTGKDIQEVILWATSHEFWHKNILSADKLRKQYDKLSVQMKGEQKGVTSIAKHKQHFGESNGESYDFSKRKAW